MKLANISRLVTGWLLLPGWLLPGDGCGTQRLCRGWISIPFPAGWMQCEDTQAQPEGKEAVCLPGDKHREDVLLACSCKYMEEH